MQVHEPARRRVDSCGICGQSALTVVWDLPRFPLTEAFGDFDPQFPSWDQALMRCDFCRHIQLGWQIDPRFLYSRETYVFGSTSSPKLELEHNFLVDFIRELLPNGHCATALEFGANNLSLAHKLLGLTDQLLVCDPLLPDSPSDPRMLCLTDTVEGVIASGIAFRPELVVARHTLEHVGEPAAVVNALLDAVGAPGLLVFEVPSLAHMKAKLRFDAVTHQHIHYFDLASILGLAKATHSRLLSFRYNERGSNGGSLLFALSRHHTAVSGSSTDLPVVGSARDLGQSLSRFMAQMELLRGVVERPSEDTFGFGASLMLATLDYHLEGCISELSCIFDDDEERHQTTYRNVDISVLSTKHLPAPGTGTFVVTSFENARAIYSRLRELGAGRIVGPVLS